MTKELYNLNIERSILSSIIFEPSRFDEISSYLKPDYFYLPAHQRFFQAMIDVHEEELPIDEDFIKKKIDSEDFDENAFLEVVSTYPLSETRAYVDEIVELFTKRELLTLTTEIKKITTEEDIPSEEAVDIVQQLLYKITTDNTSKDFRDGENIAVSTLEQIKKNKELGNKGVIGVDTGFLALNDITRGFGKGDMVIIAARPAMGKCLGKGTKVLMYSGELRRVEDVKPGDLLMGDDSTPRKVLSIARGRERMYWIRQNKGVDYRVNESHILSLKRSRNEGKHKHGDVLNISVKDYINKSDKFKSNYKGYKVSVDFEPKKVLVDPYFLGLWLGDGKKSDVRIATKDKEVVQFLEKYSKKLKLTLTTNKQENRCPVYAITSGKKGGDVKNSGSLQKKLRDLGVIDNKHIPKKYLLNSTKKRLKLLAGLIDSDGYYDKKFKSYEITQKNRELAEDIKFLCDSLGFRTSLKTKKAKLKSRGYECDVYRVRFSGNIDTIPVKVRRKKASSWTAKRSWNQTGIDVVYDKVDDYYGFEIDGNRLFLLEDMTVTHNTAFVLNMANNILHQNKGVAFFSLEMPAEQLLMRMMSSKTSIPLQNLKVGDMTDEQWSHLSNAADFYSKSKLFVDDDGLLTIAKLRSKLRDLKTKHPEVEIAVIDYIQLMSGNSGKDRHLEVSEISRGIKMLARELDMPIVALSQLNRGLESRPDKRPMLSDIRESGSIEQDADIIMFVYRDDVYREREEKQKEKQASADGKEYTSTFKAKMEEDAELIIGKHRNGPIGTVDLVFHKRYTRFVDKSEISVKETTFEMNETQIPVTIEQPVNAKPPIATDGNDEIDMPVI